MEETKEETPVEKTLAEKIESLNEQNSRMEKNIAELKEIKALEAMGGKTNAEPQEAPKEESPEEYVKKIMANEHEK